jgi:hypothetical protein
MPPKTFYRYDTHDCHVDCTDGLGHLKSVEISNRLYEKHPHDMNYSANYQYGRDASSVCRTYPVGLANSSLSSFSFFSGGKNKDFKSIVVLEPPCLEKGHDPENVFSIPYLSPVNKNSRRGMKHKQSEFPVMENGRVWQHILGTDGNNMPRIRKERFLTRDPIDPLQIGQEASVHQFGNTDVSYSGSSQKYSCGNDNFWQTNRSSSNSTQLKICRHAESAVGSKTLAEMFALSDSGRLKLNSDSHAPIRRKLTGHDNGCSQDGCFIVLPKHPPLLCVRSSMDMNSCLEGSSEGKYNSNISNIYNNGKCQFDSLPIFTNQELKQIGTGCEAHLSNACCFQNHTGDNLSTPDWLNEKVLFTTNEHLGQQPAESEASRLNLQVSRKQWVCVLASINLENQKGNVPEDTCILNYSYHYKLKSSTINSLTNIAFSICIYASCSDIFLMVLGFHALLHCY